jgi:hypothetical protein
MILYHNTNTEKYSMSDKPKPITINATVYWANLTTKNDYSGKYQVDLGQLSDVAVEALQQRGMDVKNTPPADEDKVDRGNYITCKSTRPMKAYNTAGDEISELVGNGSEAKAAIGYYDWTSPTGKKGRSPSMLKLVVTELEVYVAPASLDVDMEATL